MTQDQFMFQMQRCVEVWGRNGFTDGRMKYIWDHARDLHDNQLARVVSHFIGTMSRCPMPSHFIEAIKKEKAAARAGNWKEDQREAEPIKCEDCMDTGYAPIDPDVGMTVWAICYCERGTQESKLEKQIPQLEADMRSLIVRYPLSSFRPVDGQVDEGSMWQKIEWWKAQLEVSRDYWKYETTNKGA